MKLRKSISVDFRPSKTRDDGTAVQIERDCSIEIGAVRVITVPVGTAVLGCSVARSSTRFARNNWRSAAPLDSRGRLSAHGLC